MTKYPGFVRFRQSSIQEKYDLKVLMMSCVWTRPSSSFLQKSANLKYSTFISLMHLSVFEVFHFFTFWNKNYDPHDLDFPPKYGILQTHITFIKGTKNLKKWNTSDSNTSVFYLYTKCRILQHSTYIPNVCIIVWYTVTRQLNSNIGFYLGVSKSHIQSCKNSITNIKHLYEYTKVLI